MDSAAYVFQDLAVPDGDGGAKVGALRTLVGEHSQRQIGGGPVAPDGRPIATATDAARAAVAYLDDEARGKLLQKWLKEESADRRKSGRWSARLEALRSIVSPHVSDRAWNAVVCEHWSGQWAHQRRLANALAGAGTVKGTSYTPEGWLSASMRSRLGVTQR